MVLSVLDSPHLASFILNSHVKSLADFNLNFRFLVGRPVLIKLNGRVTPKYALQFCCSFLNYSCSVIELLLSYNKTV